MAQNNALCNFDRSEKSFLDPSTDQKPVAEIVVTGPKSPAALTADNQSGRIASMRKVTTKRDLDPDKWFNNVEPGHGGESRH